MADSVQLSCKIGQPISLFQWLVQKYRDIQLMHESNYKTHVPGYYWTMAPCPTQFSMYLSRLSVHEFTHSSPPPWPSLEDNNPPGGVITLLGG